MKSQQQLEKLVALRRQKAEQAVGLATIEVRQMESGLADLEAQFGKLDAASGDYESLSLSMRYGRPAQIQKQIDTKRKALELKRQELETARHALKKAIHSEDRLKDMAAGR